MYVVPLPGLLLLLRPFATTATTATIASPASTTAASATAAAAAVTPIPTAAVSVQGSPRREILPGQR